jgi:hypothetical protein
VKKIKNFFMSHPLVFTIVFLSVLSVISLALYEDKYPCASCVENAYYYPDGPSGERVYDDSLCDHICKAN